MLSTASETATAPRTPSHNIAAKSDAAMPAVVISDEAYSLFGEQGDSIFNDLMQTDDQIMNYIEGPGAIENLLGSVFSPARVPGLGSPHVSHVLMSPYRHGSPRRSPRSFSTLPWSPYPPSEGSIRRSVRITPARGAYIRDFDSVLDFESTQTPNDGASQSPKDSKNAHKKPSSKKALKMGASTNADDFEEYVLAPLSPFTPATATAEGAADRGKAKLAFTSDSKKKSAAKRSATGVKRGEYKCGKCGFFPKKDKHDCAAFKRKCQLEGIEIQTRVRKSGGKKKAKSKNIKSTPSPGDLHTVDMADIPIMASVSTIVG